MDVFVVKPDNTIPINFAPATLEEEVTQNVRMILSTPQMSVPLDRGFGLSQRFVDKPMQSVAETVLVSDVLDAIEAYEPRAQVEHIDFEYDLQRPGKLIPVVGVTIIDQQE